MAAEAPIRPARGWLGRLLLPTGAHASVLALLVAHALRAFVDGYVAVLLPAYRLAIGLGTLEIGVVATATLLGSALATIAVGAYGHRFQTSGLLRGAALLMAATGVVWTVSSPVDRRKGGSSALCVTSAISLDGAHAGAAGQASRVRTSDV